MCSRWYSHALAMLITPSSALRPRHGAPAACALCPLNLKRAEMRASAGSSPHEMPNSSLTCAKRFASTSRNTPARDPGGGNAGDAPLDDEPVSLEDPGEVRRGLDLLHAELGVREDLVDHLLSELRPGVDGACELRLEPVEPRARGRLGGSDGGEQEAHDQATPDDAPDAPTHRLPGQRGGCASPASKCPHGLKMPRNETSHQALGGPERLAVGGRKWRFCGLSSRP